MEEKWPRPPIRQEGLPLIRQLLTPDATPLRRRAHSHVLSAQFG